MTTAEISRAGMQVPSVDGSLSARLLPFVLSLVAGSADAIAFFGLGGLFVAHVTGNLVILAAQVAFVPSLACVGAAMAAD